MGITLLPTPGSSSDSGEGKLDKAKARTNAAGDVKDRAHRATKNPTSFPPSTRAAPGGLFRAVVSIAEDGHGERGGRAEAARRHRQVNRCEDVCGQSEGDSEPSRCSMDADFLTTKSGKAFARTRRQPTAAMRPRRGRPLSDLWTLVRTSDFPRTRAPGFRSQFQRQLAAQGHRRRRNAAFGLHWKRAPVSPVSVTTPASSPGCAPSPQHLRRNQDFNLQSGSLRRRSRRRQRTRKWSFSPGLVGEGIAPQFTSDPAVFNCSCNSYNSRNFALFCACRSRDIGGRLWLSNTCGARSARSRVP